MHGAAEPVNWCEHSLPLGGYPPLATLCPDDLVQLIRHMDCLQELELLLQTQNECTRSAGAGKRRQTDCCVQRRGLESGAV